MTDRAELARQLREAKLRLDDLTRELDESRRAENEQTVHDELEKARARIVELEKAIEDLGDE